MSKLNGRVALVTGAARGHGRSHAQRLAPEGADVLLFDICGTVDDCVPYPMPSDDDLSAAADLVVAEGRRAVTAVGDVRRVDDLRAAVERAETELGPIDIVVANAGVNVVGDLSEITEDAWDAVIDVNLKGVWNTVRATAPRMIERGEGGSIILISSVGGVRGLLLMAPYVASKHGVTGLTRAFANELAPHGIRVNSIHPGSVPGTGMQISQMMSFKSQIEEEMFFLGTRGVLAGTITCEDISAAVVWLASDDARFVTGAQLPVDAGGLNKP
jgi:SDR family mycofactocin-dependent oxidoreductase